MGKKEKGSVYQRKKDGRWVAAISLGKDPKTNKRIRKQVYANSKKEAVRLLTDLKYELQHNLYADPGQITFGTFIKEWYDIHKGKIAETTADYYNKMLNKHIIPALGKIKLKDLKPLHIDKFYNDKKGTLSGNSILKLHSIIHGALEYAKYNNMLKSNPADYVSPPKKEKYKPKIMQENNFNKLLNIVKGTFDEIPILLAGCVGLRRGEVFGLRWKDIDFDNNIIKIEQTMTRFSKYITKKPKNNTSARSFVMPRFVANVLKEYRNSLKVVPETVCDKYKPQSYSKHFKKLLENNGIEPVRFHDLRHFNAIIMMKYGVPDKIASGRLGHSQVSTTREIYQHVIPDMDKQAAEIINNIFDKAK